VLGCTRYFNRAVFSFSGIENLMTSALRGLGLFLEPCNGQIWAAGSNGLAKGQTRVQIDFSKI